MVDYTLPSNASPLQRVLERVAQAILDTPVPVREVWDPWLCPEPLLPWLAWAFSVDLWEDDWPITKRRSVIANAIKHHRLKGTLAGIKTYVALMDSAVVRAIRPPSVVFSGPSLTREQREAWLETLPQVRVYRDWNRGTAGSRLFSGGTHWPSFLNAPADADHPNGYHEHFAQPEAALERLQHKAKWFKGDVELDARVDTAFESYFRVYVPGKRPMAVFCNVPFGGGYYFQPSTAWQRVYTIEPLSTSPWRNPVGPRLTPVSMQPDRIAQRGTEGPAVYSGRPIYARFFVPSTARFRLFDRYAVSDGTSPLRRPSIQFMGDGRYGMPAKTAEIKVRMRGTRNPLQAGEGIVAPRTRFWLPHDDSLLQKNIRAIVAAKRLTDKILLDTNTQPGFIAGLPLFAGDKFLAR